MLKKSLLLCFALPFALVSHSNAEQLSLDELLPHSKASSSQVEQLSLDDLLAKSKSDVRLVGTINHVDFFKKIENNQNLRQEDLQYFPDSLRKYLRDEADWEVLNYTGFSRKLSRATYLFNVTLKEWDPNSYAVLVTIQAGEVSAKTVQWRKLVLPYLTILEDRDEVIASPDHQRLVWVESNRKVQTKICFLHGACLRNSYTIYPEDHKLLQMEFKQSEKAKWESIWENGKWVVEKNKLLGR